MPVKETTARTPTEEQIDKENNAARARYAKTFKKHKTQRKMAKASRRRNRR